MSSEKVKEAQQNVIKQIEITISECIKLADAGVYIPNNKFTEAVSFTLQANISPEEFARELNISLPTVYRWCDGSSHPHMLGRGAATKSMKKLIMEKNPVVFAKKKSARERSIEKFDDIFFKPAIEILDNGIKEAIENHKTSFMGEFIVDGIYLTREHILESQLWQKKIADLECEENIILLHKLIRASSGKADVGIVMIANFQ